MVHIIVKQSYAHHNKSLPNWDTPKGVWVKNKDHYDRLCKENGMISYDKAKEMATGPKLKAYELKEDSKKFLAAVNLKKSRDGKVKLSDKEIDFMIKKKAISKKIPEYMKLSSAYTKKGGFV